MVINIIGAGKLGKTIGKLLLCSDNEIKIGGLLCSSLQSTSNAKKFIGAGNECNSINDLPRADIYFITTPDDEIENTCQLLAKQHDLNENNIVVHCSGSLASDVLCAAKKKGAKIASIHPIKSFASPEESVQTFTGTYCACEGDNEALRELKKIFKRMGGKTFMINKNKKSLYHAAGVFALNYLVTLSYVANQCYIKSGVKNNTAKKIVQNIMSDVISNLSTLTHKEALTGPLERGDLNTIEKHIDSLSATPDIAKLYKILAVNTVELTKHKGKIGVES